jgi:hypothetical protein
MDSGCKVERNQECRGLSESNNIRAWREQVTSIIAAERRLP